MSVLGPFPAQMGLDLSMLERVMSMNDKVVCRESIDSGIWIFTTGQVIGSDKVLLFFLLLYTLVSYLLSEKKGFLHLKTSW